MLKQIKQWVLLGLLVPVLSLAQTANPNENVESVVRASFPDMPAMIDIAKCESGFRQFNADGTVLRGGTGKNYIGIFQISESVHKNVALSMGYDINTVDGNIAYARYQYFARGTAPWISCLGSAPVVGAPVPTIAQPNPAPTPAPNQTTTAVVTGSLGTLNTNLSYRMVHPDIVILQKILNKNGFTVSDSGAGSPGQETAMFGDLTRAAVRKFQCAKGIVCDGSESTTGYGRVGPMTRAALNALP